MVRKPLQGGGPAARVRVTVNGGNQGGVVCDTRQGSSRMFGYFMCNEMLRTKVCVFAVVTVRAWMKALGLKRLNVTTSELNGGVSSLNVSTKKFL